MSRPEPLAGFRCRLFTSPDRPRERRFYDPPGQELGGFIFAECSQVTVVRIEERRRIPQPKGPPRLVRSSMPLPEEYPAPGQRVCYGSKYCKLHPATPDAPAAVLVRDYTSEDRGLRTWIVPAGIVRLEDGGIARGFMPGQAYAVPYDFPEALWSSLVDGLGAVPVCDRYETTDYYHTRRASVFEAFTAAQLLHSDGPTSPEPTP